MHIVPLNNFEAIKEIYLKHYAKEFSFPDFKNFLFKYIIVNEEGNIVTGGGVRLIPEMILLTNKDCNVQDRKKGLLTALDFSIYNCKQMNLDSIHIFTKDTLWYRRLVRTGFSPIQGDGLILDI